MCLMGAETGVNMAQDEGSTLETTFHLKSGYPDGTPEPSSEVVHRVIELGTEVLAAEKQLEAAKAALEQARRAAYEFTRAYRTGGAMLVGECFQTDSFLSRAGHAAVPNCD